MKGTKLFLALLALSAACYALAEVYRVVNADGTVTYTDNPPAGDPTVEPMDLPKINTQPALQMPTMTKKADDKEEEGLTGYKQIRIASPAPGATIPPGYEQIPVKVSTEPGLQQGHLIQLIFNGKPYGSPSPMTSFSISPIIRGEHSIQAKILDSNKDIVGKSGTITVHVKRHSIQNNRN